jgi:hypothetical protein
LKQFIGASIILPSLMTVAGCDKILPLLGMAARKRKIQRESDDISVIAVFIAFHNEQHVLSGVLPL